MEGMRRITKTAKNRTFLKDYIKTITQENPSSGRENTAEQHITLQVILFFDRSQRNLRRV
jgi:hypothetical protein